MLQANGHSSVRRHTKTIRKEEKSYVNVTNTWNIAASKTIRKEENICVNVTNTWNIAALEDI